MQPAVCSGLARRMPDCGSLPSNVLHVDRALQLCSDSLQHPPGQPAQITLQRVLADQARAEYLQQKKMQSFHTYGEWEMGKPFFRLIVFNLQLSTCDAAAVVAAVGGGW